MASPTAGLLVATIESAFPPFQIAPEMIPGRAAEDVYKLQGCLLTYVRKAVTIGDESRTPATAEDLIGVHMALEA